jgi:hypothetical protein
MLRTPGSIVVERESSCSFFDNSAWSCYESCFLASISSCTNGFPLFEIQLAKGKRTTIRLAFEDRVELKLMPPKQQILPL